MKIQNGPGINPTMGSSHQKMIDEIMEVQSAPIKQAENFKEKLIQEKNEYSSLNTLVGDLGNSVKGLATKSQFTKLKAESSHPDIMEAAISGFAMPGNYEFEVKGLAQAAKYLDVGFPDKNDTPVGFGYMGIETSDGETIDVTIDPGSTLDDVARRINESTSEHKAQIINTGHKEDPFKLLVSSVKTGAASKIHIDEDTTFLDFKNIKQGRDLDVMFEDVQLTGSENKLNELLDGVSIDLKKAEAGTKVNLNVTTDLEKSADGIKDFTDKYNQILSFANNQKNVQENGKTGSLVSDSGLRTVVRRLQSAVTSPIGKSGTFQSLAQIGITTNAKSGELNINEDKLKQALTKDYDQVMELFSYTDNGKGLANQVSDAAKGLMDPSHGVVNSRTKSLQKQIKSQDKEIEKQTQKLEQSRARLKGQFAALDSNMAVMQNKSQFLSARLNNG